MKLSKLFLTLAAAAVGSFSAQAQISVGPSGVGPLTFDEFPILPVTEWATGAIGGTANTAYGNAASVAAGVQTNTAASISTLLPRITALGTAAQARHNTNPAAGYLLTQVTGSGATLLKAVLRNNSGGQISHLDVTYDFGVQVVGPSESSPGHVTMFSTNGQINNWQPIPTLTGLSAATPNVTATLFVGVWEPNTDIYLVWADDNAETGTEGAYTIDNFRISNLVPTNAIIPLSVSLGSPANGAVFVKPATITGDATTSGTLPVTGVAFHVNGAHLASDLTAPYTVSVTDPPVGIYTVQAFATNNANEVAASTIHTITVRDEFALLNNTPFSEDFDSMLATGTLTPLGWYVGAALPATTSTVVVDNGSLGVSANYLGLNYGTTADPDRALGTAPTGGDRNIVLRLKNNTSSNVVAFVVKYDGETWRAHTNVVVTQYLTNFVSVDNGATWILTGANYVSPVPPQATAIALDGNDPANRVPDITSTTITPPTPVSPGGTLLVRWLDNNDAGADGGMAVDNFSFDVTAWSEYTLTVAITSPADASTIEVACPSSLTINATASGLTTNVAFVVDAGAPVNDTTAPFSVTLPGVGVGPHSITATARDSLGNIATHTINVTVIANQPPVVMLTNVFSGPNPGPMFLVGSPITNQFSAVDNNLATLEFLVNNVVIFSTNVAYGQMVVGDALAGVSTYTVRATDACGNMISASQMVTVTNPPATIVVANGSSWKYSNLGAQPANDGMNRQWFESGYDDAAWPSGLAELGNGDAVSPVAGGATPVPEATLINIGPAVKYSAIYFRHTFMAAAPLGGLSVHSLHDDGAVVYLNGTIVATFNMTGAGPFAYANLATGQLNDDGTVYYSSNITASLNVGLNTLAVEVHQNATGSSDLSFDCMLWSTGGPPLTVTTSGNSYTVSWIDPGNLYKLQQSGDLSNPANWMDVPTDPASPYMQTLPAPPSSRFFQLKLRP